MAATFLAALVERFNVTLATVSGFPPLTEDEVPEATATSPVPPLPCVLLVDLKEKPQGYQTDSGNPSWTKGTVSFLILVSNDKVGCDAFAHTLIAAYTPTCLTITTASCPQPILMREGYEIVQLAHRDPNGYAVFQARVDYSCIM